MKQIEKNTYIKLLVAYFLFFSILWGAVYLIPQETYQFIPEGIQGLVLVFVYGGAIASFFIVIMRRLSTLGHSVLFVLFLLVPWINLAFVIYLVFAKPQKIESKDFAEHIPDEIG